LRHSFESFGAGASLGLPIIGKLLGHSQAATTHRYAHLDADPLRRAVETIGNTIASAMEGAKPVNVVSIKQGKGQ
jgi:integrase